MQISQNFNFHIFPSSKAVAAVVLFLPVIIIIIIIYIIIFNQKIMLNEYTR